MKVVLDDGREEHEQVCTMSFHISAEGAVEIELDKYDGETLMVYPDTQVDVSAEL